MEVGDKFYFLTRDGLIPTSFSVEVHVLEKIYKNGDIKLECNLREPVEPINKLIKDKELFLNKKALLRQIAKIFNN